MHEVVISTETLPKVFTASLFTGLFERGVVRAGHVCMPCMSIQCSKSCGPVHVQRVRAKPLVQKVA
jgi:hypothetical protein